jgi:hypothetical protein
MGAIGGARVGRSTGLQLARLCGRVDPSVRPSISGLGIGAASRAGCGSL